MPTVSDLISIQIAIDGSAVTTGGDDAARAIDQVKTKLKTRADDIERVAKGIDDTLSKMLRRVGEAMSAVLSFEGMRQLTVQFAENITTMGRFAETLGISVTAVSAIGQAFERAGTSAGEVNSVLSQMKRSITDWTLYGTQPKWVQKAAGAPLLLNPYEVQKQDVDKTLLEISRRAAAGGLTASQLQAFLPGLNITDEMAANLTHPEKLQRLLRESQSTAVTPSHLAAADVLQESATAASASFSAALRDLITLTTPAIVKLTGWITTLFNWIDDIERFLIGTGVKPRDAGSTGPSEHYTPGSPASSRSLGLPSIAPFPGAPRTPLSLGPTPEFKYNAEGKIAGGINRDRFAKELEAKPWLVTKLASMVQGEVGKGAPSQTKIVQLETAFNRAQARGISLEQALLSVSEDPKRGYYASDTYHPVSAEEVERFKRDILNPVMHGSDISSSAGYGPMTGNASGGVAARQFARGTRGFVLPAAGGTQESFFAEGPFYYPFPRNVASPDSLLRVTPGAKGALGAPGPQSNNITHETTASINHITVNTNATNPAAIAKDVKEEVGRQLALPMTGPG